MLRTLAIVFLAVLPFSAGPILAQDLRLHVSMEKSRFFVGEPLTAWVVYENVGSKVLLVPGPDVRFPFVVRKSAGEALHADVEVVDYIAGDGTMRLRSGERQVFVFHLENYFTFTAGSSFTVAGRLEISGSGKATAGNELRFAGVVETEALPLTLELLDDPGVRLISDCLRPNRGIAKCVLQNASELQALPASSVLRPYAEIRRMRNDRLRFGRPKELVPWVHEFLRQYPSFGQPAFLLYEAARANANKGELDGLSKIAAEKLAQHPVVAFISGKRSAMPDDAGRDAPSEPVRSN